MPDDARTLLTMLASGAGAADIAGSDADAELRDLALQVRRGTEALVRRERGLEALVETAADLASLRDPAGVLDAIVRRARSLLGTDVAYLTLHDPSRGDTYMRATAGSVSARFQSVRLDLGAGLGGLVAQTHQPYWTSDYAGDDRFAHTQAIDSAVGDEGIVAICGTPLLVQGEFVGVLFASHRTARRYSPDEVALLGSLATLAAVTIVQVDALAELSAAHDTVRRQSDGVRRAAAAHDTFAGLVLRGGGVGEITAALVDLLGGWAVHVDDAGVTRGASGDLPEDVRSGRRYSRALPGERTERLTLDDDRWVVAITASDEPLGHLVVGSPGELDTADRRTVERAAVVTALVLLGDRRRAETEHQQRTDVVSAVLSGRHREEGVARAASRHGLDLTLPWSVLVTSSPLSPGTRSLALSVAAAAGPDVLVGEHHGRVCVLVATDDPGTAAADIARRLARVSASAPISVGGAGPVDVPEEAVDEAVRAVAALEALGRHGEGAAADDLGFAGLVIGTGPQVSPFVLRVLGPLLDYDSERGTDLVGTLDAYYAAGASPRRAAGRLHVHPNTVGQRLERVGQLMGADWQAPGRTLEIQLALHLRPLVAG